MRSDIELPFAISSEDETFPRNQQTYTGNNWYLEQYDLVTNGDLKLFESWFKGSNNEPAYLMHLLANNPIIAGLLVTKCDIIRGKRLTLFNTLDKTKGQPTPLELTDFDQELLDFYEYNELNSLTYDTCFDHETLGNYFTEIIFSKGSSKTEKKVTEIQRIAPECIRAKKQNNARRMVKEYGVSHTWANGTFIQKDVEMLPEFYHKDFYNADRQFNRRTAAKSVLMHGKRNWPMFPIYSVPRWYGARHMMEVQNLVPIFHKSNLQNMFGLRMKINVARGLIEKQLQMLDDEGNPKYKDQNAVLSAISKSMSKYFMDPTNVGKAIAVAMDYDHQGKPIHDLLFDAITIDQKDDAYTKLDGMMNQSVTSSMGTSPSLAGIIMKNNLPSGSEQRYAWNIEVAKGAFLRDLILKPIRFSHKFNQWPSHLQWGFEDAVMVTADEDKTGMKPATNQPSDEEE